jgi:hypothetical protein
MTDASRRLSVRLSVDGAQQARQELARTGEAGDQALARIVGGAQRASAALNLLGVGVGALSVGALANFARRAVDAVGGLGELADQLGVSTDALQAFRFTAIETGVLNEELERGLAILTRRIAEAASGERTAEEAFRRLGVAFTDAAGNARATEGVLADIADRIAAVESPAERARIATEVFGDRLGQRLIPFLAQGREGLERLTAEALRYGAVADAELIAKADEASDRLNKLGEAFGRLAQRVAAEAAPALTAAATLIERLAFGAPVGEQIRELGAERARIEGLRARAENGVVTATTRGGRTVRTPVAEIDRELAAIDRQLAELVEPVRSLVGLGNELRIGHRAIAQRLGRQALEALPPLRQERDQPLPEPVAEHLGGDPRPLGRALHRGDAVGDIGEHPLGRARVAGRVGERHAEPAEGFLGRPLARRCLGDPTGQDREAALELLVEHPRLDRGEAERLQRIGRDAELVGELAQAPHRIDRAAGEVGERAHRERAHTDAQQVERRGRTLRAADDARERLVPRLAGAGKLLPRLLRAIHRQPDRKTARRVSHAQASAKRAPRAIPAAARRAASRQAQAGRQGSRRCAARLEDRSPARPSPSRCRASPPASTPRPRSWSGHWRHRGRPGRSRARWPRSRGSTQARRRHAMRRGPSGVSLRLRRVRPADHRIPERDGHVVALHQRIECRGRERERRALAVAHALPGGDDAARDQPHEQHEVEAVEDGALLLRSLTEHRLRLRERSTLRRSARDPVERLHKQPHALRQLEPARLA